MKTLYFLIIIFFTLTIRASDTTQVKINLNHLEKGKLKITIYPPDINSENADFIIPSIIPGTYMQINYERFYSNFKAFTKNGERLKLSKKGNHIIIKNAKQLYKLEYFVEQTYGDKKIWDNIIPCAGTIFNKSNFLINYQLITGYFKDFKDKTYKIKYEKNEKLYGATSLEKKQISPTQDIYIANNYDQLIDNPLLYAKADTSSFNVGNSKFKISVFSQTGDVKSKQLKPKLKTIISSIKDYYGKLLTENYNFIFYYVNYDSLKPASRFGLGSALEHFNSSVYFLNETSDTSFIYNNWICTHEYLHTFTPLTIRSEKINNFNFDKPNMSKHLWFYEGLTDYTTMLIVNRYKLPYYDGFSSELASSTNTAISFKARSMTKSSENIINNNLFDWFPKILQLSNFYEKGKLISFCLDVELYKLSNGKMRLSDLILKLQSKYNRENAFNDDEFLDILVENSYPEIRDFLDKYVVGKELVPYQKYFNLMGWKYYKKNEKIPSFGKVYFWRDKETNKYYIKEIKKNSFNLQQGDSLITINGKTINTENYYYNLYLPLRIPNKNEKIQMEIIRNNKKILLTGVANKKRKIKYGIIYYLRNQTKEQKQFRQKFINRKNKSINN